VKVVLGNDFPTAPPKCKAWFNAGYESKHLNTVALGFFLTKIFHPNVSKTGEVCVNTLKKDWKKELGISHVLLVSLKRKQIQHAVDS
jgi:ubiquitin-conjugating enzyme E2 S